MTESRITSVFGIHRFVAGGFGAMMLFLPDQVYEGSGRFDAVSPKEKAVFQCWGCTILAVAASIHFGRQFPTAAQQWMAAGLISCFFSITVIYAFVGLQSDDSEVSAGLFPFLVIFAGLFVAYTWALVTGKAGPWTVVSNNKSRMQTVFAFHRWLALSSGVLAAFFPDALYWVFPRDRSTTFNEGERLIVQSWGCFLFAIAGIVQGGLALESSKHRNWIGIIQCCHFALLSIVFAMYWSDLDATYARLSHPIFVTMSLAYLWALSGPEIDNMQQKID